MRYVLHKLPKLRSLNRGPLFLKDRNFSQSQWHKNSVTKYDADNVIMAFINFKGQIMNMLHLFRLTFFTQQSLHPLAKRLIKTWSSQSTWPPVYPSFFRMCIGTADKTNKSGIAVPPKINSRELLSLVPLRAGRSGGSNPGGGEIFRTRPDRSWGPPSLLCSGHPGLSRG
jgi:hypothetical protein